MSSQEIYIPPPGISVRIVNFQSRRVLFSRTHQSPKFGHFPLGEVYDDQWWQIIPGTGSHEGTFKIKSDRTSEVLYSRQDNAPDVSTIDGDGKYDDNYFVFENGTGKLAGYFRIKAPSTNSVVFSRDHTKPEVGSYSADNKRYDDQYFTFLVEDMLLDSITFEDYNGSIEGTEPTYLGKQRLPNHTSIPQSFTANFTEQEDREYSFDHTMGLSLTAGVEFSVGVPGIADGKVSMSATHTQEFKWGSTTRTGKGTAYNFNVTAPPHTAVTAYATILKSNMRVPYTMTLRSKSTGQKVVSKGVFKGTHMYDASCTYTEDKI